MLIRVKLSRMQGRTCNTSRRLAKWPLVWVVFAGESQIKVLVFGVVLVSTNAHLGK